MNKPSLTVVPISVAGPEYLTEEVKQTLLSSECIILRTAQLPSVSWLQENHISWESLDDFYNRYDDFDEMHTAMVNKLWEKASESGQCTYCVADPKSDISVKELIRNKPQNAEFRILPGVSLFDLYSSVCPELMLEESITVLPAASAISAVYDSALPYLVTEIDSSICAGEIKLWLENQYDDEAEVVLMSFEKGAGKVKRIPFWEMDHMKHYDHTTALYVPPQRGIQKNHYSFSDLNMLMDRLRAIDGCPWDREQTHQSLKTYMLEETWEVLEAIDREDPDHLADELGDLLFQIVFHSSIGKSFDEFTVQDVLDHICKKMIFRHSHVFGNDHCKNAEEVSANWEKRKREESGSSSLSDSVRQVSEALPSLTYATKVLKKAKQFPWWNEESADILKKLCSETGTESELLIKAVLKCYENHVDPEILLHETVKKLSETLINHK